MPDLAYDFYSPFLAAAIVTSDGRRFPLWVNTDGTGAPDRAGQLTQSEVGITSLAFVDGISVELQLAYLPKIQVTFSPTYRDGIAFLDSPLVEWGTSTIEVQFGYTAGTPRGPVLSPIYSGLLLKPDISLGTDIQITMNAQGVGGFSAVRTERNKQFTKMTRLKIVEELAKGPDPANVRNLEVDASEVIDGSDAKAKKWFTEDTVDMSSSNLTDWFLIWKLVRESNCWMILVNQGKPLKPTIRIFPRNSALGAQPKYTLRYFDYPDGKVGPVNGVFPIISAQSPTSAIYLPGSTRGLVVGGVSSATKDVLLKSYTDSGENDSDAVKPTVTNKGAIAAEGHKDNPGVNQASKDGMSALSVDPNHPNVEAMAHAEFASQTFLMGVQLTVETLGMPDILPGDVVAVHGLGKRLTGNYGVFKVTHSVGSGGYATSLELVSNTGPMLQKIREAQGDVNEKDPPPPESQGTKTVQAKTENWSPKITTG